MIPLQRGPIPPGRSRHRPGGPPPTGTTPAPSDPRFPAGPGILVTTSRRADPLVRRIGRDLAFAAGGRYVTRGKGGLSQPPFCDGTVFVLSRDREGIRMQVLGGTAGKAVLHFASVREEVRAGPLKRGLITGSGVLLSSLPPFLPILRETGLPHTLTLHGLQGRQISLEVGP